MYDIARGLSSKVTLHDGKVMPLFGLGVYLAEDTANAVLHAVKNEYRLIDTAEYYKNETEVGKAIKQCGVPREDLFVVTKLWDKGAEICKSHFKESLTKLDLDYLDLYLIHTPNDGENIETFRNMVDLQEQGLIRSIGVSNFGVPHLQGLIDAGLPLPVVNQIELHPWSQNRETVKFCRDKGIAVMGYSPLTKGKFLNDEGLLQIAQRNERTPAQVLIRWSVQNLFITIPKSSSQKRIEENAQVFDWRLDEADMDLLTAMPQKTCMPFDACKPWKG